MKATATKAAPKYDYIGAIIAYESGELDRDDTITLFQYLISTGIIFRLQGSYQRAAQSLINAGLI